MRSRGLVVALALLLALGATAAVFLYVNGVKDNAISSGEVTTVIVSTQVIPANSSLNPLIDNGVFEERTIPKDAVVQGAITSLDQLRNRTAVSPILANEQIPAERLSGGEQAQGGALGICNDCVAVSLDVAAPNGVAGNVHAGDNITLYATFEGLKVFQSTRTLLQALQGKGGAPQQSTTDTTVEFPPFTMTLEPTVKVLQIVNPTNANSSSSDSTDQKEVSGTITATLDVPKEDAEFVIHAAEKGSLWFGLLPPDQVGLQLPAQSVSLDRFLGKKQ
jgi:pilus assembly protein CpaB